MAKTYDIVIDGKTCTAEHGEYLWDVAKRNGIEIPALCRSEAFPEHRAKLPRVYCGSDFARPLQGGYFLCVPHRRGMRGAH